MTSPSTPPSTEVLQAIREFDALINTEEDDVLIDLAPFRDLVFQAWLADPEGIPEADLPELASELALVRGETGALVQSAMWLAHVEAIMDEEGVALGEPCPVGRTMLPLVDVLLAALACPTSGAAALFFRSLL